MNITQGKREEETGFGGYEPFDVNELHTQDRNNKRRIYDRLRKRSYRAMDLWVAGRYAYALLVQHEPRSRTQHEAYVAGVREALNEVPNG